MNRRNLLLHRSTVGLLLGIAGIAAAGDLFQDEMTSGAGWGVNSTGADFSATFGYDYSADGIPEAPNSQVGDTATTGVKLEANLTDGAMSSFIIFPIGENFMGDYQLRFDVWMNYDADERINGGSAATTEFIGGGLGYDDVADGVTIGAQMVLTGDGGSGSDWRVFADGTFLDPAEMVAGSRNGVDLYYSDFLPGVAPPGSQAQVNFPPGIGGSPGFQWITVEINSLGGVANVYIEKPDLNRLHIARFNHDAMRPFTSDGNIGILYADFFTSVTTRPDLTFGIVDNVVVHGSPVPVMLQYFEVE